MLFFFIFHIFQFYFLFLGRSSISLCLACQHWILGSEVMTNQLGCPNSQTDYYILFIHLWNKVPSSKRTVTSVMVI